MATTSFTLKKTTVGGGSFLQNNGEDSALKADNFTISSNIGADNTFSANVINNQKVNLSWELSFTLSASASPTVATPLSLLIIASPTGEPITTQDGVLVKTIYSTDTITSFTDVVRVPQGRWIYYSLFVKYGYGTTTWYERVATLYIQIPISYNSVEALWSRIPTYYRDLDYDQSLYPINGEEKGPLYNFLELFGWEIDRTRTLIETIALSNDPDLAVTPALKELAYETGLEINPDVLGTTKTRALLNNIGYLRRRKGTIESVSDYLSAMTGCQITYINNPASASATYNFKVHSQRINFVVDPLFKSAISSSVTGTSPLQTRKATASTYGVYTWSTGTTGASVSTDGVSITITTGASAGTTTAVIYSKSSFPYYGSAPLYTSFEMTNVAGSASFSSFYVASNTGASSAPWEATTNGASANVSAYTVNYGSSIKLPQDLEVSNRTRVVLYPTTVSASTTNLYPGVYFTLPENCTMKLTNWMVEPYSIGNYFDGNTREGNVLPSLVGNGAGTSDYRWANGTPYTSFSYYTLDYKRVFDTTNKIIKDYIVPVTVRDKVQIDFDYYFGKT